MVNGHVRLVLCLLLLFGQSCCMGPIDESCSHRFDDVDRGLKEAVVMAEETRDRLDNMHEDSVAKASYSVIFGNLDYKTNVRGAQTSSHQRTRAMLTLPCYGRRCLQPPDFRTVRAVCCHIVS